MDEVHLEPSSASQALAKTWGDAKPASSAAARRTAPASSVYCRPMRAWALMRRLHGLSPPG
eukprot:11203677-Lingulodinium_polyedra.AAC.1